MPFFVCNNPPAKLRVKIGASVEEYDFVDDQPVEVSDAAYLLLADDDEDEFEEAP